MSKQFRQIDDSEVKDRISDALCVMRYEPDQLKEMFSFSFQESFDDLDDLKYALIETIIGNQFAFIRHRGSPIGGTEVRTRTNREQSDSVLNDLLFSLGLSREDLTWIRDWSDV